MFLETARGNNNISGYAGGEKINPTYYEVCSGLTGHSEVVRVVWDTNEIDISDLLKCFGNVMTPHKKIDKVMIWALNTDLLYIIKMNLIKKLFYPVKNNIKRIK